MKLVNYTQVPDAKLRDIIRFTCPSSVANFDITFKNDGAGCLHGYAYHSGTSYHVRGGCTPPLITIHVPKGWKNLRIRRVTGNTAGGTWWAGRPARRSLGRGYMNGECFTNEEKMVDIIAHELRHLWQKKVKRGRRVWGARGQFSERDACAYAIQMTRRWRRECPSATTTRLP